MSSCSSLIASAAERSTFWTTTTFYNFVRDIVWAYISYDVYFSSIGEDRIEYGFSDHHRLLNSEAQWLYSTVAMMIAFFVQISMINLGQMLLDNSKHTACNSYLFGEVRYLETLSTIFSASISLPAWNYASYSGRVYATSTYNMQTNQALYFSSIFTGLFEGFVQESIAVILGLAISLYNGSESITRLLSNLTDAAKYSSLRLVFGLTIGALPGCFWQLIFTACYSTKVGPIGTSIFVSVVVALCNLFVCFARFYAFKGKTKWISVERMIITTSSKETSPADKRAPKSSQEEMAYSNAEIRNNSMYPI